MLPLEGSHKYSFSNVLGLYITLVFKYFWWRIKRGLTIMFAHTLYSTIIKVYIIPGLKFTQNGDGTLRDDIAQSETTHFDLIK